MTLLEQMAKNEGLGSILGKGFYGAIKELKRECEKYAVHVKGMEILFDPRACRLGVAEFYEVVGPRGGHIGLGGLFVPYLTRDLPTSVFKKLAENWGVPKDAIERIFSPPSQWNVARLTVWADIKGAVDSSLGIGCSRGRLSQFYEKAGSMQTYVDIYKAVTGLEATVNDFLTVGDRICDLVRVLNIREGFDKNKDKFPDAWFTPIIRHGKITWLEDYFGKRLTREDCEKLLDEYYSERGWDILSGRPTKDKLLKNGLDDIVADLERQGFL
jgi:aldehyde:ferredoxin oxidoreductase